MSESCVEPVAGVRVEDERAPKRARIEVPEVPGAVPVETKVTTETTYRHTLPDAEPQEPPSMKKRSGIELRCTARLLEVLFTADGATLHAFWAALRRGDAMERTDAVFELNAGKFLMCEWDGGAFHTTDRIEGDIRKTNRMLRACQTGLVVRVRADGAPPLEDAIAEGVDSADRSRVVVVHLSNRESKNVGLAVRAIAGAIGPVLATFGGAEQSQFTQRLAAAAALTDASARSSGRLAEALVFETLKKADATFVSNLQDLERVVGSEEAAKSVMDTHGVITRLSAVVKALERFRDEFGVGVDCLSQIMTESVAKRIESDSFWKAVQKVKTKLPGIKLETFMTNCVAARIESDSFWKAVQKVRTELPGIKLESFMKNSVAKRIESDSFWDAIQKVKTELPGIKMESFMTDCVAARIESDSFWDAIQKVKTELPGMKLETFMTDSVAARIENESFWQMIYKLKDKKINFAACSFGDSFFAAFDKPCFMDVVCLLLDEYGFAPEDIPRRSGFWSKIVKDGAFDAFRKHLAQCRYPSHVNERVRRMNDNRLTGKGATRCKFARPKVTPEAAPVVSARKQAKLTAFFVPK